MQMRNSSWQRRRLPRPEKALAFQVSLGKEQVHIHSLEKTVEQKTEENDEVTRIWDELISKMEEI